MNGSAKARLVSSRLTHAIGRALALAAAIGALFVANSVMAPPAVATTQYVVSGDGKFTIANVNLALSQTSTYNVSGAVTIAQYTGFNTLSGMYFSLTWVGTRADRTSASEMKASGSVPTMGATGYFRMTSSNQWGVHTTTSVHAVGYFYVVCTTTHNGKYFFDITDYWFMT